MTYRNLTLSDAVWNQARVDSARIAYQFSDGTSLSVGQVANQARVLASSLQSLGVKTGDCISIQLPNWAEFAIIDVAACGVGAVINPIVPIYREAEVEYILSDSASKVFFIPDTYRARDFVEMVVALKTRMSQPPIMVLVKSTRSKEELQKLGVKSYEQLLAGGQSKTLEMPALKADDPKLLMYTSGTTGKPKGVLHSHNSFVRTIDNLSEASGLGSDDVMFTASPVTHITGYIAIEHPFYTGGQTALMERWEKSEALNFIESTQSTFGIGATPFLQELVSECEAQGRRLPSLKRFACGGASVPPALIRHAHQVFEACRCYRLYGSTETPVVSQGCAEPNDEWSAAETDGRIYNYSVLTLADDGKPLPKGSEGELAVKGPAMMLGYSDPEKTREAFTSDGYFLTGDIGVVSDNGDVIITGRKKDLIIRGGENISAREIEDVLIQHPAIQEAVAVSMPHQRLGETIACYVITKPGHPPVTLGDIAILIRSAGLANQKIPEHLELVDELPCTPAGKVRRDLLRADIRRRISGASEVV